MSTGSVYLVRARNTSRRRGIVSSAVADSECMYVRAITADSLYQAQFKVKWNTSMGQLKRAFCRDVGARLDTLRFTFNGTRIEDHHTPELLGMAYCSIVVVDGARAETDAGPYSNVSAGFLWMYVRVVIAELPFEAMYKIKTNAMLGGLKRMFRRQAGVRTGSLRFVFNDIPIDDYHTPLLLGMINGHVIEVYRYDRTWG